MSLGKLIFICILLPICAYTILIFNPQALFSVKFSSGPLTVYSRVPVEQPARAMIDRARERAAASDFYSPDQKIEIYLVGDKLKYSLLAPFLGGYAALNPVTGKIFVALPDLERNLAADASAKDRPRMLESVIAHELVKAGLLNKFRFLSYVFMPPLKTEGYAEHIVKEAVDMNAADICAGRAEGLTIDYLKHRLVLEYLVENHNTNFPELLRSDIGDEAAAKQAMKKYCGQN